MMTKENVTATAVGRLERAVQAADAGDEATMHEACMELCCGVRELCDERVRARLVAEMFGVNWGDMSLDLLRRLNSEVRHCQDGAGS